MIKIYLRYNVFKLLFAFFCINNFVETKAVKTPGKPIFKGKSRQLNKVQQYKGKRIKCEYCSNFISDMGWNKVRHWARKHPKETGHFPEVKKALETSEKSYVCEKC